MKPSSGYFIVKKSKEYAELKHFLILYEFINSRI